MPVILGIILHTATPLLKSFARGHMAGCPSGALSPQNSACAGYKPETLEIVLHIATHVYISPQIDAHGYTLQAGNRCKI